VTAAPAITSPGTPTSTSACSGRTLATNSWISTDCSVDGTDVRGPHIQGRPGERFIYLSWGSVGDDGRFTMFRRAKLMLAEVPADVLAAAAASGTLVGTLGLTNAKGHPLCARVKPPQIYWSASETR
jgi:hypothetical protein